MNVTNIKELTRSYREFEEEIIFPKEGVMRTYKYEEDSATGEIIKSEIRWYKRNISFGRQTAGWMSLTDLESNHLEKIYNTLNK